jgi:hypothetical protein
MNSGVYANGRARSAGLGLHLGGRSHAMFEQFYDVAGITKVIHVWIYCRARPAEVGGNALVLCWNCACTMPADTQG